MVKKAVSINLVRTDKNQTLNQIVDWALGAGRILIIVVELIALSAFLYRFILDSQIRDLNDKINQEQTVVAQQKKNEAKYADLQARLALIASFSNQASDSIKIFKDIVSFAPVGLTFSNVTFTDTAIRIGVSVNSVNPLTTFVSSLKNYPKVDSVSIDKIENKPESAVINVSISVNLKKESDANSVN